MPNYGMPVRSFASRLRSIQKALISLFIYGRDIHCARVLHQLFSQFYYVSIRVGLIVYVISKVCLFFQGTLSVYLAH